MDKNTKTILIIVAVVAGLYLASTQTDMFAISSSNTRKSILYPIKSDAEPLESNVIGFISRQYVKIPFSSSVPLKNPIIFCEYSNLDSHPISFKGVSYTNDKAVSSLSSTRFPSAYILNDKVKNYGSFAFQYPSTLTASDGIIMLYLEVTRPYDQYGPTGQDNDGIMICQLLNGQTKRAIDLAQVATLRGFKGSY